MHKLQAFAFLWSYTLALGSCLCDNMSKNRQRQAVVLLLMPPRKPCDRCDLCVSASLLRTFSHHVHQLRVSVPPNLPVSPKATAIAFKSFHLLLSPNTEYGGQGRIVQAIIAPKYSPCLRSLFSPCFAEGHSDSDKSVYRDARYTKGTQRRRDRRGRGAVTPK